MGAKAIVGGNGVKGKLKKPVGHSIWFKIILTILVFIPSYTQVGYDPSKTTDVIAAVMSHSVVSSVVWALPIAKAVLLAVIVIPLVPAKFTQRFLLGYYALILFIIGLLQNMSFTEEFGFVWLLGNTFVQFAVLGICLVDVLKNRTVVAKEQLVKGRLWVVVPMLVAFLMPYSINSAGIVYPSFTLNVLLNEAGVTYCMVTPVIIGILLLFSKGVHKPTLSIISYVGFIFGLLNMMTWFGIRTDNWWMGVLHLPLLILSFYGLIIAYKEKSLA